MVHTTPVDNRLRPLAELYLRIKRELIENGYGPEIDWQDEQRPNQFSESDLLREAAWVILCSGFRESVIASKFAAISMAFMYWESAHSVVVNEIRCRSDALKVFGHLGKVEAILEVARYIDAVSFPGVREACRRDPISFLSTFRFVGPVTARHLAKNLGYDVAKADRHLLRVAAATGHETPDSLCHQLAALMGERVSVVDLVIWRHAVTTPDYEELWRNAARVPRHHRS